MSYNAKIGSLLAEADEDWGNHEQNLKHIITYNVSPEFDTAMWGLDLLEGELVVIQAPKKQRKSTLLANFCINFLPQLNHKGYWMDIDTLESGMTPKAYRDVLVSMLATRIMVGAVFGTKREEWPPPKSIIANTVLMEELRLTKKFLRFGTRSDTQQAAIETAKNALSMFPLTIWGAAKKTGESRDLDATIRRWELLYDGEYVHETKGEAPVDYTGCKHRVFACDNVQQYRQYAGNSYQGLEIITNAISGFVTSHPGAAVIAVSQVSLTSARDFQAGNGEMESRGGSRLSEEATTVFQTTYDKDKDPYHIVIATPYSRYEPPPTIAQPVEPFSGSFLGLAKLKYGG